MSLFRRRKLPPQTESPVTLLPTHVEASPQSVSREADKSYVAPKTLAEVREQQRIQLGLLQDARKRGLSDGEFPGLLRAAIHEGAIPPLANVLAKKDGGSVSMSIIISELPDNALTVTLTENPRQPGGISHAEIAVRLPEEDEAPFLREYAIKAPSLGSEPPLNLDQILSQMPPSHQ